MWSLLDFDPDRHINTSHSKSKENEDRFEREERLMSELIEEKAAIFKEGIDRLILHENSISRI
jgi:hypothetical protein